MTTYDPADGGYCAVGRQLSSGPALDIFAASPNGIFQTWYSEANDWNFAPGTTDTLVMQPLAAPNASQKFIHLPSVASWSPDRLDLFVVSADGELWHWWVSDENQPQSGWGGESLGHPGHGPLVSAPTAVTQQVDKITVFARVGIDGALFACVWDPANGRSWEWFSASSQLGWASEPSPFALSPAACSWDPSRIDLFAVKGTLAQGGTLQHTWQQDFPGSPDWHPAYWEEVPSTFGTTSSPVSVSWLDQQQVQQISAVYCGLTGIEGTSVGITRWLGDHWATDNVYVQGDSTIAVAGFPALASWAPGRLDAFWWRSDYTLQHYWSITGGDQWEPPENFNLQFPGG